MSQASATVITTGAIVSTGAHDLVDVMAGVALAAVAIGIASAELQPAANAVPGAPS